MLGLASAPELDREGITWFNVSRPLRVADLRGRLVVLDFWTACCVNCLHVQPILRRLSETFAEAIAVIGVHSPKYPAEQDGDSARDAIARCDIRHPVAHDPHLKLWHAYGIAGWPTLVFVDPRGRILGDLPGEPDADKLISGIGEMVRSWRCPTRQAPLPLPLSSEAGVTTAGRFRFPAKLKPLRQPGRPLQWAIADSGHHQIVVCDDAGRERMRFGRGKPGFLDLANGAAAFNNPQGLTCDGDTILVADTGNHAIRRIDLSTGDVTTLAGTGARGAVLEAPCPGSEAALASVWDIERCGDRLVFANAGTHQLGVLDLNDGRVAPLAGNGNEDMLDGDAESAQLAQPTGLAFDATRNSLYFVDSETSSVRSLDFADAGRVRTLVGGGLFESGRRNGGFRAARLQHCRGIACWGDRLVVADSYNGVLRVLDLRTQLVSEIGGDDCRWANGLQLAGGQPAGVAVDGDRLLVADTNHHRLVEIRMGDPPTAEVWAT